jgi:hypothetical protein
MFKGMNKKIFVLFSFSIVSLLLLTSGVLGATTSSLVPTGNGFYTSWTGDYTDVDEGTISPSCSSNDYISSFTNNNRESFIINLSSIPNGATITSVNITVADRADSNSGGTYKLFTRFNSAELEGSTLTVSSSSGCNLRSAQSFDVTDAIKSGTTTLDVGVVKTGTSYPASNSVRVGAISVVVTYTPSQTCGNSQIEGTEVCDLNSQSCSINGYSGNQLCNSQCNGWNTCTSTQYCGDGIKNGQESCDEGTANNGQPNHCNAQCSGQTTPICGNSIIETGEQCESPFDSCCDTSICQFKSAQTSCRASTGLCDIAETCTGSSATCPSDSKQPLGFSCSNELFCDGAETCDGTGTCLSGTAPVVNDELFCTTDSCDEANDLILHSSINVNDNVRCTEDSCDEANDLILHNPQNSLCNDELYCNGVETCSETLDCQSGTAVSCSGNDLLEILTCNNNPDDNPFTLDFRNAFTSTCNEDLDICSVGNSAVISTCDVATCGAQCDSQHSCADKVCGTDGCVGNDYYDYSNISNACLENCSCEDNSCGAPVITTKDARCGECAIDTDQDSIFDCNDNCPSTANQDQLDSDVDGIGDVCDIAAPVVVVSAPSSGGGGGSSYCATKWTCSEWGACYGNVQTRTCSYPANFCTPEVSKPAIMQSCTSPVAENTNANANTNEETNKPVTTQTGFLTGAVTGITDFAKTGAGTAVIISVLLIGGTVTFFSVRRGIAKKKKK